MEFGGADGAERTFVGKEFLVIGGTQFMGRHVVCSLLKLGANVTILNRGKTQNPFLNEPNVVHLKCDRLNESKKVRLLLGAGPAGRDGSALWDGVIDFVCFRKKGIEDIISQAHKIRHYIFISTDSVFMACDRSHVLAQQGEAGLREEAALPPKTAKAKAAAKMNDEYQYSYGKGKLDCELRLAEGGGRSRLEFSQYTILRLPDVIGPFDNLGSHLRLQQNLESSKPIGTKVGSACGRISVVGAVILSTSSEPLFLPLACMQV